MQDKIVVNFIVARSRPCTAAEMTGQIALGQRFETTGLEVRPDRQIYGANSGTRLLSYVSYYLAFYSSSKAFRLIVEEATNLDLDALQATFSSQ
jgi:hypothetical protein